jgi:hypothetical protein
MAIEDYTTYSESDDNEKVTIVDANTVTIDNLFLLEDPDTWLVSDKTAGHFTGDFSHLVEAQFDSPETGYAFANVSPWILANAIDSIGAAGQTDSDYFILQYPNQFSQHRRFLLRSWRSGASDDTDYTDISVLSVDLKYFITITRTSGDYAVYIRTGSHTGDLIDTLIISPASTGTWRYIFAVNHGEGGSSNRRINATFENLDLQEAPDYNITYINGIDITTISKIFGIALADIQSINGIDVLQS